jgi:CDGSH-type Zn-finger protein
MNEPGANRSIVVQKAPYGIEVEAGKTYFWCACGRSKQQPFCDGSHAGTGIRPVSYAAEAAKKLWFCGCKATKTTPFCDGSHKNLP